MTTRHQTSIGAIGRRGMRRRGYYSLDGIKKKKRRKERGKKDRTDSSMKKKKREKVFNGEGVEPRARSFYV